MKHCIGEEFHLAILRYRINTIHVASKTIETRKMNKILQKIRAEQVRVSLFYSGFKQ